MLNEELLSYLTELFENDDLNRLPKEFGGSKIFFKPLIGVAKGDDPIFLKYKEVVGPEHLTPLELWNKSVKNPIKDSDLRIVSIVFPFDEIIRRKGQEPLILKNFKLPAEIYSIARNYANDFIEDTLRKSAEFLKSKGYDAIVGVLSEEFSLIVKGNFYSTWSERHMAFAAGLGTFSLHEGFISEVGCNIRLGSFVTNAPFKITPRRSDNPYGNCLYYHDGTCKKCIEKCPANAISEEGHDKIKCNNYRLKISRRMVPRLKQYLKPYTRRINWKMIEHSFPVGCAFCQFGVPCMDKNPITTQ